MLYFKDIFFFVIYNIYSTSYDKIEIPKQIQLYRFLSLQYR